ncbi:cytochrome P450 [Aspergillus karnatakaensis]|uniref:cytochrome P450 n=1 Tax=Aspergillus karnatakaensis TaxID=1810916 RepID=UPI003CCCADA4
MLAFTHLGVSLWGWGLLVPGLLAVYWLLWTIYARFLHPYAKFPGPFLASVSRAWIVIDILKGQTHVTQAALHKRYGSIVRIAPNELAISDASAIRKIYSVNSGFTKTDFYLPIRPTFASPDLFTELNETAHATKRKILNNIYTMSSILASETAIDTCTDLFMARMDEFAEQDTPVNLTGWSQWYASDVIGHLFLGSKFGFMEQRRDVDGYIASIDALLPVQAAACVIPAYLRPLFFASGRLVGFLKRASRAAARFEEVSARCVIERMESIDLTKDDGFNPDILTKLLRICRDEEDMHGFSAADAQAEVWVGLAAGGDTTATAISSILYYLMKTPDALRRLYTEIDSATAAAKLSRPRIKYSEAIKLPYLVACCKEGMRMHPSVGFTLPRVVPKGGCLVAGHWLPGGLRVGVNAAIVHFDQSVFGDDADEYNPDRWFRDDAVNMERYMFQFGAGSRTCVGKNIALCEIHKLVAEILRSYRISLVNPQAKRESRNYWLHLPRETLIHIEKRRLGV